MGDRQGHVGTITSSARYREAMLLNEFLKEHRKVEEQGRKDQEQEATIAQLKSAVAQQQKEFQSTIAKQERQIQALTAGLQKVSDRLEATEAAPRLVTNTP